MYFSLIWIALLYTVCCKANIIDRSNEDLSEIAVDVWTNDTNELILSHNRISDVDSGLPSLSNMTFLDLAFNEFTSFPDLNSVKITLNVLNISDNKINFIDPSFLEKLKKVLTLEMENNLLISFPDVPGMSLKSLLLSGNNIEVFPVLTKIASDNLQRLNVDKNKIRSMSKEAASALHKVKNLYMGYNLMTEFPPIENYMPELRYLRIRDNLIGSVPNDLFRKMKKLSNLVINNNNVTSIPSPCSSPVPIIYLKVANNPFTCDCSLKPLKIALEAGKVDILYMKCDYPSHLYNRPFETLTVDDLNHNCPEWSSFRFDWYSRQDGGLQCGHPDIISTTTDISLLNCGLECHKTTGCYAFGFQPFVNGNNKNGTCAVSKYNVTEPVEATWDDFSVKYTSL